MNQIKHNLTVLLMKELLKCAFHHLFDGFMYFQVKDRLVVQASGHGFRLRIMLRKWLGQLL